jgi:hypothetical protein
LLCITLLITPSNNGGFGIFCQNTCFYLFESNESLIGGRRLLAWLGWRASIHVGAIVHFCCAFRVSTMTSAWSSSRRVVCSFSWRALLSCKLFIKEAMTRLGSRLWCHEIRDSRTRSERNFDRLLRLFSMLATTKRRSFQGGFVFPS